MARSLATRHDTPVGDFTIVTNDAAAVVGAGFTVDEGRLLAPIHPSLRPAALIWRDAALKGWLLDHEGIGGQVVLFR